MLLKRSREGSCPPHGAWARLRGIMRHRLLVGTFCVQMHTNKRIYDDCVRRWCSFMGYEELNVIDPTTGKPVKAETDMSDVRGCID